MQIFAAGGHDVCSTCSPFGEQVHNFTSTDFNAELWRYMDDVGQVSVESLAELTARET